MDFFEAAVLLGVAVAILEAVLMVAVVVGEVEELSRPVDEVYLEVEDEVEVRLEAEVVGEAALGSSPPLMAQQAVIPRH